MNQQLEGEKLALTEQQLLAQAEYLLRNRPEIDDIDNEEGLVWRADIRALFTVANRIDLKSEFLILESRLKSSTFRYDALPQIFVILRQLISEVRLKTLGPISSALSSGQMFDYFDSVRKIIETATKDILFIDPYLDAEFVSRYLPHVHSNVSVRLLGGKFKTLVPAVDMYCKQNSVSVEIRESGELHDRFVIVDKTNCYQSGASFKDGAKKADTIITEITDAFEPILDLYETRWKNGVVKYP